MWGVYGFGSEGGRRELDGSQVGVGTALWVWEYGLSAKGNSLGGVTLCDWCFEYVTGGIRAHSGGLLEQFVGEMVVA